MNWGICIEKYLRGEVICKYYGDKKCPCVSNKAIKKQYDKRGGYWASGLPLPECDNCKSFEQINVEDQISILEKGLTNVEKSLALAQNKQKEKRKKEMGNTPVRVILLNATGGTAAERAAKMIIGGALLGGIGALIGLLGSDQSNTKLIFQVEYANAKTEVVTEKADSKRAEELLKMVKTV